MKLTVAVQSYIMAEIGNRRYIICHVETRMVATIESILLKHSVKYIQGLTKLCLPRAKMKVVIGIRDAESSLAQKSAPDRTPSGRSADCLFVLQRVVLHS